jgi:lipoprotein-anchoring transpeptidase ErfK/SrfK
MLGRLVLSACVALAITGTAEAATTKAKVVERPPSLLEQLFGNPDPKKKKKPPAKISTTLPKPSGGFRLFQQQALYPEDVPRGRVVPPQFKRTEVTYRTSEPAGTIIIDTRQHFLYYVLGNDRALRYGVGVGRQGFGWSGEVKVASKQEWPAWHPPKEMIARELKRGHRLPARMEGGEGNPLGARALYLHDTKGDTGYRIHGTREPWTIGLNVSSGCIRLVNDDVIDLYNRTKIGAKVIVL